MVWLGFLNLPSKYRYSALCCLYFWEVSQLFLSYPDGSGQRNHLSWVIFIFSSSLLMTGYCQRLYSATLLFFPFCYTCYICQQVDVHFASPNSVYSAAAFVLTGQIHAECRFSGEKHTQACRTEGKTKTYPHFQEVVDFFRPTSPKEVIKFLFLWQSSFLSVSYETRVSSAVAFYYKVAEFITLRCIV